jgi:hypothetical protein
MRWWIEHEEPIVPATHLPKIGVFYEDLAVGFLYQTDSAIGFLENFVANPEAHPRQVHAALVEVTNELAKIAAGLKLEHVMVLTQRVSVGKVIERCGFQKTTDLTCYAARVN